MGHHGSSCWHACMCRLGSLLLPPHHAAAAHGGGRRSRQVLHLEDEVHGVAHGDDLACGRLGWGRGGRGEGGFRGRASVARVAAFIKVYTARRLRQLVPVGAAGMQGGAPELRQSFLLSSSTVFMFSIQMASTAGGGGGAGDRVGAGTGGALEH